MIIREASEKDIGAITKIYTHYVKNSTATAECTPPTQAIMKERFIGIVQNDFPYLVAEEEGEIIGYAYATNFAEREAYQFSASFTIYLAANQSGKGAGTKLLQALEERLSDKNIHNLVALISSDNQSSIAFHEKHGFKEIGHFPHAMYKFDKWVDLTWLLKQYPIEQSAIKRIAVRTNEQIEILFELITEIWQEVFTDIIGADQVAYMLEHYQSIKNITDEINQGTQYYLLMYKNTVVGYTAYDIQDDKIYISKLYIRHDFRGKGLMSDVFKFYENIGKGKALFLNVNQNNQQAIAIYEHKGFKRVGERYVDIGEGYVMNDYIYEKLIE